MNHSEKAKAILHIRPLAEFTLLGDDLTWLDETQAEPTEAEIKAGWTSYQKAQTSEIKAKTEAKFALLNRLGITEDEAQLLLG
jgi:hypothetical protein